MKSAVLCKLRQHQFLKLQNKKVIAFFALLL